MSVLDGLNPIATILPQAPMLGAGLWSFHQHQPLVGLPAVWAAPSSDCTRLSISIRQNVSSHPASGKREGSHPAASGKQNVHYADLCEQHLSSPCAFSCTSAPPPPLFCGEPMCRGCGIGRQAMLRWLSQWRTIAKGLFGGARHLT